MGPPELKIAHFPRAIIDMWERLPPIHKIYVEKKIGYLTSLIHLGARIPMIKALSHFWNPESSSFVIGQCELTPTLEEYDTMIGPVGTFGLATPPLEVNSVSLLSQFLKVNSTLIRNILKGNTNAIPITFMEELFLGLPIESGAQIPKVFILAFFGFVIFPYTNKSMTPSIVHVVLQVCSGKKFSHLILGETFISLSRFKKSGKGTLRASIGLLQVWMISHIREFATDMQITQIGSSSHPLLQFVEKNKLFPSWSFSRWFNYLKALIPIRIQWYAKWLVCPNPCLADGFDNIIPLLGLTGITSYHPLRVIRQFRAIQQIPPPLDPNPLALNYHEEVAEGRKAQLDRMICNIVHTWRDYRKTTIAMVDRSELEGNEKEHHASEDYICNALRTLPQVVIPNLPSKLTLQEILAEKAAQERDDAIRKAEALGRENKRLRQTILPNED